MFIDIANFSIVAERRSPKEVFHHLKGMMADLTRLVHKYGGTVDKTLGDGMLAFFGYSYDGETTENQADQAIACAVEIQKQNLERCVLAVDRGEPILPMRIGINTANCYVGDLGNEERIDFTVIGNGVNYAQRLEAACDHHSVMLSGTTVDFSSDFNPMSPGFKKRYINIKHHDELIEGIEFDPFHDEPGRRGMALEALRKSLNLERKQQRWPVQDPEKIIIKTEFGDATLVDFSTTGFCVRMDRYLSKGVKFAISISDPEGRLRDDLSEKGIDNVRTEVRWGRPGGGANGFVHGIQFLNLSEIQLEHLFTKLRDHFSVQEDHSYLKKDA